MVIIDKKWNTHQQAHEYTYLANNVSDVSLSKVDPDCAMGSAILVIEAGDIYIKNTAGAWQKTGGTEVLV